MKLHPFIKKITWTLTGKEPPPAAPGWVERAEAISLARFALLEQAVTKHARYLPQEVWNAIDPMAPYQAAPEALLALLDRHYNQLPKGVQQAFDAAMHDSDEQLGLTR